MCLRVNCPHQNIEIVEDKVYFSVLRRTPRSSQFVTYFTIDEDPKYRYRSFFDDFGPPSILQLTEFYRYVENSINSSKQILHFYTSPAPSLCANSVMFISFFRMIHSHISPEEAYKPFTPIQKYIYDYRDASTAPSVFELKTIDCLRGIKKAMELNWYDFHTFDSEKWAHIEAIQNGDMNWLIPGKLMAFASPYSMDVLPSGDKVATTETVISVFKELGITHIVRLNKQYYDSEDFKKNGFNFTELYFLDGSIPPPQILENFLEIIEGDDVVALHCKAGLGRTGTLAACYMIKNFDFTAREAIAWIRVCRPGSVIGPQQLFLVSYEEEQQKVKNRSAVLVREPSSSSSYYSARDRRREIMPEVPKSARILFVPFKGCPMQLDSGDDEVPENMKLARSARGRYNRQTRQSARAPSNRIKRPFSDDKYTCVQALQMNAIHPQPRKINQKQPYWRTIGAFA